MTQAGNLTERGSEQSGKRKKHNWDKAQLHEHFPAKTAQPLRFSQYASLN